MFILYFLSVPDTSVNFIRKKINRHKELLENKASNVDIEVTEDEIKVVGQWFVKGTLNFTLILDKICFKVMIFDY